MRHLPAQAARAELAGAAERGRRGAAHALAVELVARAETDEDPALAARVGDGEMAVLGARLAGGDEAVEDPVDVVVDLLVVAGRR